MKAIILAAGEGKRMRPLTLTTPKPMLEVLGKPLLHHIIDSLPKAINELIIVIGYKGDQIKKYFGSDFEGRKIQYVLQKEQLGTAHGLWLCKEYLKPKERFLFMVGDDLHSPKALEGLISGETLKVLAQDHDDPRRFGVVEADAKGLVTGFVEKPEKPRSNLVSPGVFVLDDRIFNYPLVKHSRLGEYFMPEVVMQLIKDHKVYIERTEFWHPVGYPHDILSAEKMLSRGKQIPNKWKNTPVVILAGGRGTRMPENEKDKPKVLVEVGGKPLLHWQFEELRRQGFHDFRLSLGYRADMVIDWLKMSGNKEVRYAIEKEPLGTGGGLKLGSEGISEPFLAFNADDLADVNFKSLIEHGVHGPSHVLAGREIKDAKAFGLLECDEYKHICKFQEKRPDATTGIVSIGHYYLLPDIFDGTPKSFSIEHDVFPKLAAANKLVLYTHTGYWFPTGTPEELKITREYFAKMH